MKDLQNNCVRDLPRNYQISSLKEARVKRSSTFTFQYRTETITKINCCLLHLFTTYGFCELPHIYFIVVTSSNILQTGYICVFARGGWKFGMTRSDSGFHLWAERQERPSGNEQDWQLERNMQLKFLLSLRRKEHTVKKRT